MKEIKNSSELNKHILTSATKSDVLAGSDIKGKYIVIPNPETFMLADAKNKKAIDKGKKFKIYEQGKIGFVNGHEKLTSIKSDNTEISEQIKLPEKENVSIETLIKEINDSIHQCKLYIQEMNDAAQSNNAVSFKEAQSKLKKEVHKLDSNALQLAINNKKANLYDATVTLVNVSNAITEFQKETAREFSLQEYQQKIIKETRENPYALHLKAMMEMKENLGKSELEGTLANVNGVVHKTPYGPLTHSAMDTANKHQHEEGVTAIRDNVMGPKSDTTYEVDVDDLLTNGETNIDYAKALNVACDIEQEDKVRSLLDD